MTCKVYIVNNETGEGRWHEDRGSDLWLTDPEAFFYLWSDGGNLSCDCNRELLWARAGGAEDAPDRGCGETRFSVPYAEADGRRILLDERE